MLAPIVAAVLLAATQPYDTVFTADGGRVVGTVVEEGPAGVTVRMPDGTMRHLSRRDAVRIQYADGSVSQAQPSQPAPQQAPPPPPSYAPPPPSYAPSYPPPPPRYYPPPPPRYAQPAYVNRGEPVAPVYLTLGIGGLGMAGRAESGVKMSQLFEPQLNFNFEVGVRLNLYTALGFYGDFGWGDPAFDVRTAPGQCESVGADCSASTSRFGLFVRHTFHPTARATPWILVGTGYEQGKLTQSVGGFTDSEATYSGWEMLRLQLGYDFRSSPVFGFGPYLGASAGHYTHYEDTNVSEHVSGGTHWMFEGGIRLILFP